jgi:hypothetical protein
MHPRETMLPGDFDPISDRSKARSQWGRHLRPDAEHTDAQTVFPDIIAHIRGSKEHNYLVIEVKKDTSTRNRNDDLEKLKAYERELHYDFALFIEFRTRQDPGIADIRWIGLDST